jgi:hypothetical protein
MLPNVSLTLGCIILPSEQGQLGCVLKLHQGPEYPHHQAIFQLLLWRKG